MEEVVPVVHWLKCRVFQPMVWWADITIIGPDTIAPVDKAASTYNHKPIKLDGKLELDVVFDDKAVQTPVYLKMDSTHQLFRSEGVCNLLGIVTYHPSVLIQK